MITLIVAMGLNNEIGLNNQLLSYLPKDLKRFKELTSGHPIIMGRKTYQSIGKPLSNRTNIVVSRASDWFEEGILIVGSIKEAIKFAKKIDEDIFIIGGGEIYKQTLDLADRLEVTRMHKNFEADAFFPKIDPKKWQLTEDTFNSKEGEEPRAYSFQTYEKIESI